MIKIGDKIEHIRIVGRLGQGGMGEVFAGIDEKLNRRVAVKVLRRERLPGRRRKKRLLREARILSRLNHPGICRIYDLIEHPDGDLLLMEQIDGLDLGALRPQSLPFQKCLDIAIGIAEVLVVTHEEGIIHRDLKPENVMLNDSGVKVLDFGIARPVPKVTLEKESGSRDSSTGGFSQSAGLDGSSGDSRSGDGHSGDGSTGDIPLGFDEELSSDLGETADPHWMAATPLYMSPEQARQESLTTASDMFSFGLLLQELFTGESLSDSGRLPVEQLLRRAKGETKPVVGLDSDLTALIERMKALKPQNRPRAADTLRYLRQIADRPRRRRVRALATAAISLLVLFALGMSFLAFRLGQSAHDLELARQRATDQASKAMARRLAAESSLRADQDLDLSLLLAIEAHNKADISESRSALLEGLSAQPRLLNAYKDGRGINDLVYTYDGERAFAAQIDTIRVLRARDFKELRTIEGHIGRVFDLDLSPDGEHLASAGEDSTLRIWSVADGQPVGEPIMGPAGISFWKVVWTLDERLVTASSDHKIRIWDPATKSVRIFAEGEGWPLAFSADNRFLAFNTDHYNVEIWDFAAQRRLGRVHTGDRSMWVASFSPDGQRLLTAGHGTVDIWEVPDGTPLMSLPGHTLTVKAAAWSTDGRKVYTGGGDGNVLRWDINRRQLDRAFKSSEEIQALALSPDNQKLFVGTYRGALLQKDVSTAVPMGEILPLVGNALTVGTWSPDGRWLAVSGVDHEIRIVESESLTVRGVLYGTPGIGIWRLVWSPDGKMLISGSEDGRIHRWDWAKGQEIGEPMTGHQDEIADIRISPEEHTLASASKDGTLRLWDIATGAPVGSPIVGHRGMVRGATWLDANRIASAGSGGVIRIWDVSAMADGGAATAVTEPLTGHQDDILAVMASPDGKIFASAGEDFIVRIWDGTDYALLHSLTGHNDNLWTLGFSPDGKYLASAGVDLLTIVWDVQTGEEIARLGKQRGSIYGLEWHPKINLLALVDTAGTLLVRDLRGDTQGWRDAICDRVERNLHPIEWDLYLGPDPYRPTCPQLSELPSTSTP